ncbi:MAG: ATP-dependent Clp protease ATP-binding subunit [Candidatus Levybacteria bacterium]|nr:ATP-dependent Clp protease ATP-binding subunit [Candidatus Levybacteria bacterium]
MFTNARIYHFYQTIPVFFLRAILAGILIGGLIMDIYHGLFPRFSFFFLSLVLMAEIFVRFKLGKTKPTLPISKNEKHFFLSMTWPAFCAYVNTASTDKFLEMLLLRKQTQFILEKAEITQKELAITSLTKDEIVAYAARIAKELHGTYITTMDLIVASLLLSEGETKLLFKKQLKPAMLLHILYWARSQYRGEEHPSIAEVNFSGEGFGEMLVAGWTPETKNYTTDWTSKALREKPLLLGRQEQYKEVIEGLLKNEHNNVLLVGDSGVGKETLLISLVHDSYSGKLPGFLKHKRLLELDLGSLIAGATEKGELTARLEAIISEVSHAGNIILVIPEFQHVLGSTSFNLNLSGALMPYLKSGTLPIIATITKGNYKAYVEQDPIREAFTIVTLLEPDYDTALRMLLQKAVSIESYYRVSISYNAVIAALEHAHVYLPDDVLPGSAVTLLTDAANTVSLAGKEGPVINSKKIVEASDIIKKIQEKMHVTVGTPDATESQTLLHLEEILHKRVIGQNDAIRVTAEALRRVRTGLSAGKKPVSFLFLGPTGVGKTETAKALAASYFGGEDKIIRLDMSEYTGDDGVKRLLGAPPGEGDERGELTDKIHDHPFSLVLLDEFEKAHPKILDLFLQVFDDGRLTDNKGKTVSFVNAIIIATSNAGSEFIRQAVKEGEAEEEDFQKKLLEYLQTKQIFVPELLNRFDAIVTFKPLTEEEIHKVVKLMLSELEQKLTKQDITLTFGDEVVSVIAKSGFDKAFGARPLRRYIQDTIEDTIAQMKLAGKIQRGNTVIISVNNNTLQYTVR